MDNDDIVQTQDVAAARASVLQTRRKVLAAAVAVPVLTAMFVFLIAYQLSSLGVVASFALACVFLSLGVPVFSHWLRHYRSILGQLDAIDRRVSSGETVYGSQVAFHSYR